MQYLLLSWQFQWKQQSQRDKYGAVPVTIKVNQITKDIDANIVLNKGDSFTFYLNGLYEMNQHYIHNFEPQFEIDENIIVHIGKLDVGVDGIDGENYYPVQGKHGTYTVFEDKAYNVNYPIGQSVANALNESQ